MVLMNGSRLGMLSELLHYVSWTFVNQIKTFAKLAMTNSLKQVWDNVKAAPLRLNPFLNSGEASMSASWERWNHINDITSAVQTMGIDYPTFTQGVRKKFNLQSSSYKRILKLICSLANEFLNRSLSELCSLPPL